MIVRIALILSVVSTSLSVTALVAITRGHVGPAVALLGAAVLTCWLAWRCLSRYGPPAHGGTVKPRPHDPDDFWSIL